MNLKSVKIRNFRSIVDSGWIGFSPDNVTVFVGQNESGKSSILESISTALGATALRDEDLRVAAPLPEVFVKASIKWETLEEQIEGFIDASKDILKKYHRDNEGIFSVKIGWNKSYKDGKIIYQKTLSLEDGKLSGLLGDLKLPESTLAEGEDISKEEKKLLNGYGLALILYNLLPKPVLFNAESGVLPNQIDLNDENEPIGDGAHAAENFLQLLDIDIEDLVNEDRRFRENVLNKANAQISEDFISFWSQEIGRSGRLSLQCDIENYGSGHGEKTGKPHLVFWIKDNGVQLYPRQRSMGVRWFISFYLQLKASEKTEGRKIFLFDEPGANLHSKAQGDVLNLLNKLSKNIEIVYSTHSPHLIEYSKLYRVYAVQRSDEEEDGPTTVIDAHKLGTASSDTLSPVLTAMGANFSSQDVIKRTNNVLLEEMSGYYYLKAFWRLFNVNQEAHFIAATGVNKLETLVNMFLGWGLDFLVAVDDDKQGREVYKNIKQNIFGNNEDLAEKQLLKFPGCPAIEEAFSQNDFKKYVLENETLKYTSENGEYLKSAKVSKPISAFNFWLKVSSGALKGEDFDAESTKKINAIIGGIVSRLSA